MNVVPPTILPSNPAPGRRLMIVRDDSAVAASQLLAFEDLTRPNSSGPSTANSTESLPLSQRDDDAGSNGASASLSKPAAGSRRRWNILRNLRMFGAAGNGAARGKEDQLPRASPARGTQDPLRRVGGGRDGCSEPGSASVDELGRATARPRGPARGVRSCFRFSLEWSDKPSILVQKLFPPSLPPSALDTLTTADRSPASSARSTSVGARPPPDVPAKDHPTTSSSSPSSASSSASVSASASPSPGLSDGAKYMGRALAEWMLVVTECQIFFERRKNDGVPGDAWVETPMLGVDWVRRM